MALPTHSKSHRPKRCFVPSKRFTMVDDLTSPNATSCLLAVVSASTLKKAIAAATANDVIVASALDVTIGFTGASSPLTTYGIKVFGISKLKVSFRGLTFDGFVIDRTLPGIYVVGKGKPKAGNGPQVLCSGVTMKRFRLVPRGTQVDIASRGAALSANVGARVSILASTVRDNYAAAGGALQSTGRSQMYLCQVAFAGKGAGPANLAGVQASSAQDVWVGNLSSLVMLSRSSPAAVSGSVSPPPARPLPAAQAVPPPPAPGSQPPPATSPPASQALPPPAAPGSQPPPATPPAVQALPPPAAPGSQPPPATSPPAAQAVPPPAALGSQPPPATSLPAAQAVPPPAAPGSQPPPATSPPAAQALPLTAAQALPPSAAPESQPPPATLPPAAEALPPPAAPGSQPPPANSPPAAQAVPPPAANRSQPPTVPPVSPAAEKAAPSPPPAAPPLAGGIAAPTSASAACATTERTSSSSNWWLSSAPPSGPSFFATPTPSSPGHSLCPSPFPVSSSPVLIDKGSGDAAASCYYDAQCSDYKIVSIHRTKSLSA
eukprot:jgi/Mesen1/9005/ME000563S08330